MRNVEICRMWTTVCQLITLSVNTCVAYTPTAGNVRGSAWRDIICSMYN